MYAVEWSEEAVRRLRKLDKAVSEAILRRAVRLAVSPERHGKRLRELNLWSLRAGDYRVLYVIDFRMRSVLVVTLGHRGSIYDRT